MKFNFYRKSRIGNCFNFIGKTVKVKTVELNSFLGTTHRIRLQIGTVAFPHVVFFFVQKGDEWLIRSEMISYAFNNMFPLIVTH